MLRLALVALLLANVLFFGWVRGWFAPSLMPPQDADREPQRVAAQVNPASVRVVSAGAVAPAGPAAALRCMEAGPFTEPALAAAEAALAQAGIAATAYAREPGVGGGGSMLRFARADAALRAQLIGLGTSQPALASGFRFCGEER